MLTGTKRQRQPDTQRGLPITQQMMHPASAGQVQRIPEFIGTKRAKNSNARDESNDQGPYRQVTESEGEFQNRGDISNAIKMRFTEKSGRKLYQRETDADRKGKKVGRWSRTEHLRFVQALQKFGKADSWKVQEYVGTRTGKQI
jgi:hypothetical protein